MNFPQTSQRHGRLHGWKTLLAAFLFTAVAAFAANEEGDSPFQGNRRPGILAEPTDEPTGENAKLYDRMGHPGPQELLDLLSEEPKISALSKDEILEAPSSIDGESLKPSLSEPDDY